MVMLKGDNVESVNDTMWVFNHPNGDHVIKFNIIWDGQNPKLENCGSSHVEGVKTPTWMIIIIMFT